MLRLLTMIFVRLLTIILPAFGRTRGVVTRAGPRNRRSASPPARIEGRFRPGPFVHFIGRFWYDFDDCLTVNQARWLFRPFPPPERSSDRR